MTGIRKLAKVFTKIIEVSHWVATGLVAAVGVLSVAAPELLKYIMDVESLQREQVASVYGFEVVAANPAGEINYTTLLLFALGAVAIFVLMALIFRKLNQVIVSSEGSTPFQQANIRRLRQIGLYSILIPVAGLVMSVLIRLVGGVDAVEISIDLQGFVMGIVVLCLTEFFVHGAELEEQVDGLV